MLGSFANGTGGPHEAYRRNIFTKFFLLCRVSIFPRAPGGYPGSLIASDPDRWPRDTHFCGSYRKLFLVQPDHYIRRGRGGLESLQVSGARTGMGLTHRFFFLRARLLIFHLEIKEIKAPTTNFLYPFNGCAAVHRRNFTFYFPGPRTALRRSKSAAKFRVGG